MGILSFIGWSSMWSIFGIVSLITMIWFAGPTIAIGDTKPLEPIWARILLAAIICLIFFGYHLYQWYKNKKLNAHVIEEIKASETASDKTNGSNTALKDRFTNIETALQRHNEKQHKGFFQRIFADKNDYIYQKPWFLVVGAPGVGKTTTILNSGLTFPIGTADNASKLVGTHDCDWFLTDEALLLDTAGRFVEHNDDLNNSNDWQELLSLLKRCRTKQPVNGVVLMLSVDDILSGDSDKIEKQLQQIRLRLQELQKSLNTTFPLYITVNKIDLINGFNQFFNYLDENERKKTFGLELDPLQNTTAEKINHMSLEIDKMVERVQKNLFHSVAFNNQHNDPSDLAIGFSTEFAHFSEALKTFLKRLLNLSKYDADLSLAGIYFTSAVQTENQVVQSSSATNYDLHHKYTDDNYSTLVPKGKGYFINALFQDLLLNTANLAGVDKVWLNKRRKIYWACLILGSLILLALLIWFMRAFKHNENYLSAVSNELNKVETQSKQVDSTNIPQLLNFTQSVYELPSKNISKQYLDQSFTKNFGLNQFKDIQKAAYSKHQSIIDENLIPEISNQIDDQLKKSIESKDYNSVYRNLKSYLMLHNSKYYNNEFINQWVVSDLMRLNGEASTSNATNSLKKALASKRIIATNQYDPALVELARQELLHEDVSRLIYTDLVRYVQQLDQRSLPVVSFVSMGGPSTATLFRRVSSNTLSDPISVLYTKYGYQNIFKPYVNKRISDFYDKEKWVLGDKIDLQTPDQVISDIYQIYGLQYSEAWRRYISDVRMLQPQNLQQAIAMSKQLSEKNSSLAGIIRGISLNTNLMTLPTTNDEDLNKTATDIAKETVKAEAVLKSKIDETKIQGYLQGISNNFSSFQSLTQSNTESGAQLDEIVKSINDLYVYLVALQLSMQSDDQLLPDTTPLVNYKAQVNRLPDPFRPMLDHFVGQVTNSSQQYRDMQLLDVAKQQDGIVQANCKSITANKYPFVNTNQEVSLQELSHLFGKEGIYLKTLEANVTVSQNHKVPFSVLVDNPAIKRKSNYLNAEKVNMQYFAGRNAPRIDYVMKIVAMDKSIDNLSVQHDGKQVQYYHGPEPTVILSWPAKDNQFAIEVKSSNEKPETLSVKGEWAVFRLIESANKVIPTSDGKGVLATFLLDQKKVYIEFRTLSGSNLFNLAAIREFKC